MVQTKIVTKTMVKGMRTMSGAALRRPLLIYLGANCCTMFFCSHVVPPQTPTGFSPHALRLLSQTFPEPVFPFLMSHHTCAVRGGQTDAAGSLRCPRHRYTKDLRRLGRNMSDVFILENSPYSAWMNKRNAILIPDYFKDNPRCCEMFWNGSHVPPQRGYNFQRAFGVAIILEMLRM